jgi:hypothetical protein
VVLAGAGKPGGMKVNVSFARNTVVAAHFTRVSTCALTSNIVSWGLKYAQEDSGRG